MSNWDMIGHEWAVDYLRRSIEAGRAAHAYIISGPEGIGKNLLALRFAQTLNCKLGGPDPCLSCRHCKRIASGSHPDVRVTGLQTQAAILGLKEEQAEKQKVLRVELIRSFQGDITLRPYEARRRILILQDAEKLSEQASNALLKTLEEPPPYATLILIANSGGDLLPTVTSRCQALKLRPLARQQVAQALMERKNLAEPDAKLLAAWSGGRLGWAMQMVDRPEELEARQEQLDHLIELPSKGRASAFRWAEECAKEYRAGQQQSVFATLELWQSWWRDVLLTIADCRDAVTHIDRQDQLDAIARRAKLPEIHAFISRLSAAATHLRENANPQLVFEHVVLHLPSR